MPTKVAIACQGGGSQTAFTAGVLKSFFDNGLQDKRQIIGLSGTSGGAICATLTWYALVKAGKGDNRPVSARLMDFWEDNTAATLFDAFWNDLLIGMLRLIDGGYLPRWEVSPASPWAQALSAVWKASVPNPKLYDLRSLLQDHIDFKEIQEWGHSADLVLLLGAANVLKGTFKKFSSAKGEISVESLMASAAVPEIFPPVPIGPDYFWDGLYSDNPPIDDLLDVNTVGAGNKPDELWIIQINPKTRRRVPVSIQEIIDRRNEMTGNDSLYQQLSTIQLINRLLAEEKLANGAGDAYKKIEIRIIEMPPGLQQKLDLPTKLDRNRRFIRTMIGEGEKSGREFLDSQRLL